MKRVHLLIGLMIFGGITSINARSLAQLERMNIEEVQRKKLARQKELVRKPVYGMLDEILLDRGQKTTMRILKENIDWSTVFHIIDSMKNVISVNEYSCPLDIPWNEEVSLLDIAVETDNLAAVKTLLEKYKANPNKGLYSVLMAACEHNNVPMVKLILQYGGNPNQKNPTESNKTAFHYAADKPEILKLLRQRQSSAAAA